MTSSAGFTALHTAARDGPRATVDMLLKKGLNPNETTPRGFTPLFMAMNGKLNLANVEALLKAGADPNGKSISGESLVEVARRLKNSRLEKLLVDAGATN